MTWWLFALGQATGILAGIGLGQVIFGGPHRRHRWFLRVTRWAWDLFGTQGQGAPDGAESGGGTCVRCKQTATYEPRLSTREWWTHDDKAIDLDHRVRVDRDTVSYGPNWTRRTVR